MQKMLFTALGVVLDNHRTGNENPAGTQDEGRRVQSVLRWARSSD